METKVLQKTTGMKLMVLSFALFMLLSGSINAQDHHRHHHGPPPVIDSIILSQIHEWDSIFHSEFHDTAIVFYHHDTMLPPHACDSSHFAGHIPDSIPGPPFNWGDSTWFGGGHHHDNDSLPGPPPPNWGDSTSTGGGHQHGNAPPPPNWLDSIWAGFGHHGDDTLPGPPPPPNWGDSTWWAGGGFDTTDHHAHHKNLLIGSDNSPSASLLVFPNPVFETATIRIQNASSTVTFRMYETTGRLVSEMMNLSNGDFQLIKGNLTSGIYFYEMLDGNTITSKGSVVIR